MSTTTPHPALTDPRPFHAERLAWIAALPHGWGESGREKQASQTALYAARAALDLLADDRPVWSAGPLDDGGIMLEQSEVSRSRGTCTTIEVTPDGLCETHILGLAGPASGEVHLVHESQSGDVAEAVETTLRARDAIRAEIAETAP